MYLTSELKCGSMNESGGTTLSGKIGYCCKTVREDSKHGYVSIPELNFRGTTATWVRNNPKQAEDKLWELTQHNIHALKRMVEHIGELDEHRRMARVGSDVFPLYTHPDVQHFWTRSDVRDMAAKVLEQVGSIGRDRGVRLSFHPGQHCCIVSDREDESKIL